MEQKTIMALMLVVLVLVSAVQAFQLNALKEKVKINGGLTLSTSSSSNAVAAQGDSGKKIASVPSSVKELPQMVGGC